MPYEKDKGMSMLGRNLWGREITAVVNQINCTFFTLHQGFIDVNPVRMAYFVSSAMLSRLSFFIMLLRCTSMVLILTPSVKAISLVLLPSAIS